jgi:hypothetical protein
MHFFGGPRVLTWLFFLPLSPTLRTVYVQVPSQKLPQLELTFSRWLGSRPNRTQDLRNTYSLVRSHGATYLPVSYHIPTRATTSSWELPHCPRSTTFPLSYHISLRAVRSPQELPHLSKSYQISPRATTSPQELPHLPKSCQISPRATISLKEL